MNKLLFILCLFIGTSVFLSCSSDDEKESNINGLKDTLFHYEDTLKHVSLGEELRITALKNVLLSEVYNDKHKVGGGILDPNNYIAFYSDWKVGDEFKFHWLTINQLDRKTFTFKVDSSYIGNVKWIRIGITNGAFDSIKLVLNK